MHLVPVCVVVLAQKRPVELSRLLDSLDATEGNFSVEIQIDRLRPRKLFSNQVDLRVLHVAQQWSSARKSKVQVAERWLGVRGQWLEAANVSLSRHTLIVEDDVVLSPAWLEFLREAPRPDDYAGLSLQRQRHRLDRYDDEENGRLGRLRVKDGLFLFPHVGSWAFSPDPRFWTEFLDWFPKHASKIPRLEEDSLIQRWYRDSLRASRQEHATRRRGLPDSMWTAHFDWFCEKKKKMIEHASILKNSFAFATSYRSDGEHYSNINKPDSDLVTLEVWHQVKESLLSSRITVTSLSGLLVAPLDKSTW